MVFKLLFILLGLAIFVASDQIIEQQDDASLEPGLYRVRRSEPGHGRRQSKGPTKYEAGVRYGKGPFSANAGASRQSGGHTQYGAGVRYDKGPFSATAGIQHQRRGPTNANVGVEYRFKRSAEDMESLESLENMDTITEVHEEPKRTKRQVTFNAMQRSLTNNRVGKPQFGRPTFQGGYFNNRKNFGGRVGGSAGVKVWESGRNSIGLGAAGAANVGLARGRPFLNRPEVGAGIGYQRGAFSATVGAGRQHRGQTTYGLGLNYRFKRSAPESLEYDIVEKEDDTDNIDDTTVEDVEEPTREKRQATTDAMQRSLTNNPVGKPEFGRPYLQGGYFQDKKNFGGRVGGSAGVKVWESGRNSVGVGAAGAANVGMAGGRPFAKSPEVGVGVGYQRGPFSATVGAGHQHRGQTTYGLGLNYRFKRSAPESLEYELVEKEDDTDNIDDKTVEDVEEPTREKRQVTTDAMQRSLTNNPVGKPEFGRPSLQGGYFQDKKNFGGRVGGSAGVKVWESGRSSVGLGAAGAANVGLAGGRPFAKSPEVGVGVGYQRGPFSASVGVGHGFQGRGSNTYGAGVSYRFRRSVDAEDSTDNDSESEVLGNEEDFQEFQEPEETEHILRKRQISGTAGRAMEKSLTNFPVGRLDHSKDIDNRYFNNMKNFGGRATGSVGTKVWERNNKSVGVGLAADSNIGLRNGRPFATPPRAGVGVGYRQGPFSATVGMDRGRGFGRKYTNNYGVRFSYDFPRGKRDILEIQDEE